MQTFALFPGQGSQHVGMGKDLFDNFKIAKETFEEASDATHVNLKKLCFEGPESDLTLTENTQPCLLTTSVAAFRVAATELGYKPKLVAGHSLGEYSALVAVGSLPLGTAAAWVKERGRAMQVAVPAGEGSMAAIMGMDDALISKLCEVATKNAKAKRQAGAHADISVEAVVDPANFNAPGQVVIAGSRDALDEAIALVKAGGDFAGTKAIPLQVSAPFHCRLMAPARSRMAELFTAAQEHERPKMPLAPYVPNRTGRITQEPGVVFELLVEQVDNPVLWRHSVTTILETGLAHAVEFGPGKVLVGLTKRIAQPLGKTCGLSNVSDSATIKTLETLIKGASTQ